MESFIDSKLHKMESFSDIKLHKMESPHALTRMGAGVGKPASDLALRTERSEGARSRGEGTRREGRINP